MTEDVDLSIRDIYNALFAGAKLQMSFRDAAELIRFKTRLHQMKKSQEDPAVKIGMMDEKEIQMLCFAPMQDGSYRIFLQGRRDVKKYSVKILEDDNSNVTNSAAAATGTEEGDAAKTA